MPDTCEICVSKTRYTHSAREHDIAAAWADEFVGYVRTDAFSSTDSPLTYKTAIEKWDLDVGVRRMGRVLDAVEQILAARGWPESACAGVAAYVVSASTGAPGDGWQEIWNADPKAARQAAREYVRELALAD